MYCKFEIQVCDPDTVFVNFTNPFNHSVPQFIYQMGTSIPVSGAKPMITCTQSTLIKVLWKFQLKNRNKIRTISKSMSNWTSLQYGYNLHTDYYSKRMVFDAHGAALVSA